jgi:hypothetical protein
VSKKRIFPLVLLGAICVCCLIVFFREDQRQAEEKHSTSLNSPTPPAQVQLDMNSKSSVSSPSISKDEKAPEKVVPAGHQNDFRLLLDEAWEAIPSVEELRALPEAELHHTPKVIISAGTKLGHIAERLKENPELSGQAASFYSNCALNQDFPTSIRALCYSDLKKKCSTTPDAIKIDSLISQDVVNLAQKLN